MIYSFIKKNEQLFPIEKMCKVLQVSSGSYYRKHWFRWMASYGDGWGSQIASAIGTQSSAVLNNDGKLETMPAWNLGAGLAINITDKSTSDLNLNYYSIDASMYRDPAKIEGGSSGHINLIWSPIKNMETGLEIMMLERVNGDTTSGTGKRLQFMIKYLFK